MANSVDKAEANTGVLKSIFVVGANLLILVLILGAGEFAARTIQARRLGPDAYHPQTFMDRWTGWRNAPGYARVDIRHDAQGFRRDSPVALEKPPGTVRIFLLGGSTAYGSEGLFKFLDPNWQRLDNRDLIDANLERLLNQAHPERKWEVINAATNEFRMHQHQALIYAKVLAYHPDFVVFLDGHNDMSGIMSAPPGPYDAFDQTPHDDLFTAMVYPHTLSSLFLINSAWLRNNSVAWSMLQNWLARKATRSAFETSPDSNRPGPFPVPLALSDLDPPLQVKAKQQMTQADYYTLEAKRLNNILDFEGIPSLFAMQPELVLSHKKLTDIETVFADYMRKLSGRYIIYMYENLQPAISAAMTSAAADKHFTYVDLRGVFDNADQKTFTDYCHLTPLGNQMVASRLYSAMEPKVIPDLIEKSR